MERSRYVALDAMVRKHGTFAYNWMDEKEKQVFKKLNSQKLCPFYIRMVFIVSDPLLYSRFELLKLDIKRTNLNVWAFNKFK